MGFNKWLSKRKWSTVTEDQISTAISEIAPRYGTAFVAFWTDSPDGVVRPDNMLCIYIVFDRSMGYSDKPRFCDELLTALDRGAYFYARHIYNKKGSLDNLPINIAYVKRPRAAGPDEE